MGEQSDHVASDTTLRGDRAEVPNAPSPEEMRDFISRGHVDKHEEDDRTRHFGADDLHLRTELTEPFHNTSGPTHQPLCRNIFRTHGIHNASFETLLAVTLEQVISTCAQDNTTYSGTTPLFGVNLGNFIAVSTQLRVRPAVGLTGSEASVE